MYNFVTQLRTNNLINMDRKTLKSKDKGIRKGWPTIDKATHVKLSDATRANVFNPKTGRYSILKLS